MLCPRKGHKINKTNMYLERRRKITYYSKQVNNVASEAFATNFLSGLQSNVLSLLDEFIVYKK